jgi:hypothetical protein
MRFNKIGENFNGTPEVFRRRPEVLPLDTADAHAVLDHEIIRTALEQDLHASRALCEVSGFNQRQGGIALIVKVGIDHGDEFFLLLLIGPDFINRAIMHTFAAGIRPRLCATDGAKMTPFFRIAYPFCLV